MAISSAPALGATHTAVARRYLCGLAQAEDCTFESMAAVVEGGCAQQFQHFISESPWDHYPLVAQIGRDVDGACCRTASGRTMRRAARA